MGNLAAQLAVFNDKAALFNRAFEAFDNVFGLKRFFDEIIGAAFHRLDGHGHIAVPGHQDHRYVAIGGKNRFGETDSVHFGHFHIGQNHTGEIRCNIAKRITGVSIDRDLKIRQFQPLRQRHTHGFIVINNDDVCLTFRRCLIVGRHDVYSLSSGRRTSKHAPPDVML